MGKYFKPNDNKKNPPKTKRGVWRTVAEKVGSFIMIAGTIAGAIAGAKNIRKRKKNT